MRKLIRLIKQLTCKHVYIDLRKIGFERCILCYKVRKNGRV